MKKTIKKTKKMTPVEAGRKGGLMLRDARDHNYYVAIGRKGGATVRAAFAALEREHEKKGRGRK